MTGFQGYVFHGTRTMASADAIADEGLRPPKASRAKLAPYPGAVYLTESLSLAGQFAIGIPPGRVGSQHCKEPVGHLFAFNSQDLDRIRPDEDSVGLFAFEHTAQNRHTGHRWRPREPSGYRFGPAIAAEALEHETQVVWDWLRANVRAALWDDLSWIDGQKAFGKAAVKVMPEEVSELFLSWGAHIAHSGRVLRPVGRWTLNVADCHKMAPDGSNLFDFADRLFGPNLPLDPEFAMDEPSSPHFGPSARRG